MNEESRGKRRKRKSAIAYGGRTEPKRETWRNEPITLRERWLIGLVVLWVGVTLFFYRGGLGPTGNWVSLGLGLITYLTAFVPLGDRFEKGWQIRFEPLRKLLRFPIFWIGGALLLYAGIQLHNTAYIYSSDGGGLARMVPQAHIDWLPSGVIVPLDRASNPFTVLVQLMLPWMMVSVLVCGFSNRRSWWMVARWVLGLIVIWACMALWHYHTGMKALYGLIDMGVNNRPPYWGSFKNPNHGGFIQVMGGGLALAMSAYAYRRAVLRGESYGLAVFLFLVAAFLGYATLDCLSRGAVLLFVGLIGGYLVLLLGIAVRNGQKKQGGLVLGMFILVGLACSGYLVSKQNNASNDAYNWTINKTVKQLNGDYVDDRLNVYSVAYRYGIEKLPWGSGIGSWRYFYTHYIQSGEEKIAYRLIKKKKINPKTGKRDNIYYQRPLVWEHAHNDWLQMFCEFGIGWLLTVGVSFLMILRWGWKHGRGLQSMEWMLIAGIGAIGLGSAYEFPLRTPALGLVFAVMLGFLIQEVRRRTGGKKGH